MKRLLAFVLLIAMISGTSGCEAKGRQAVSAKAVMPFKDRMFIYNNGLKIEPKQLDTVDDKKIKNFSNYPVISGLKDKKVQDKLNEEIPKVLQDMMMQLELKHPEKEDITGKYKQKNKSANITYNCNNVMFVEYYVGIDMASNRDYYIPIYDYTGIGYDLNTGKRLELSDLFKPGVDYRKRINLFISQYIIENNYDDYEYELMTKPFQGVREDQVFSLSLDNLVVFLDEKNDEFVSNGYPQTIYIPFKYLGDDLYVFDKYYEEGKNIYEAKKLTKKLFPNKIEFIPTKYIEDGTNKWHTRVMQGRFINIPDADVEKKINEMIVPTVDVEKFKREAEEYVLAYANENYYGDYIHNIEAAFNKGGYLSVVAADELYRNDKF